MGSYGFLNISQGFNVGSSQNIGHQCNDYCAQCVFNKEVYKRQCPRQGFLFLDFQDLIWIRFGQVLNGFQSGFGCFSLVFIFYLYFGYISRGFHVGIFRGFYVGLSWNIGRQCNDYWLSGTQISPNYHHTQLAHQLLIQMTTQDISFIHILTLTNNVTYQSTWTLHKLDPIITVKGTIQRMTQ